jgi:hypothetical protein
MGTTAAPGDGDRTEPLRRSASGNRTCRRIALIQPEHLNPAQVRRAMMLDSAPSRGVRILGRPWDGGLCSRWSLRGEFRCQVADAVEFGVCCPASGTRPRTRSAKGSRGWTDQAVSSELGAAASSTAVKKLKPRMK